MSGFYYRAKPGRIRYKANDEPLDWKGCGRKVGHRTRKKALRAADRMRLTNGGGSFEPYQCPDCGLWHLAGRHQDGDHE